MNTETNIPNDDKSHDVLKISNISLKTKKQLTCMARYYGQTLSGFVKHSLKKLVEDAPEHVKNYSED